MGLGPVNRCKIAHLAKSRLELPGSYFQIPIASSGCGTRHRRFRSGAGFARRSCAFRPNASSFVTTTAAETFQRPRFRGTRNAVIAWITAAKCSPLNAWLVASRGRSDRSPRRIPACTAGSPKGSTTSTMPLTCFQTDAAQSSQGTAVSQPLTSWTYKRSWNPFPSYSTHQATGRIAGVGGSFLARLKATTLDCQQSS